MVLIAMAYCCVMTPAEMFLTQLSQGVALEGYVFEAYLLEEIALEIAGESTCLLVAKRINDRSKVRVEMCFPD